jgi:hypothetical protein
MATRAPVAPLAWLGPPRPGPARPKPSGCRGHRRAGAAQRRAVQAHGSTATARRARADRGTAAGRATARASSAGPATPARRGPRPRATRRPPVGKAAGRGRARAGTRTGAPPPCCARPPVPPGRRLAVRARRPPTASPARGYLDQQASTHRSRLSKNRRRRLTEVDKLRPPAGPSAPPSARFGCAAAGRDRARVWVLMPFRAGSRCRDCSGRRCGRRKHGRRGPRSRRGRNRNGA